METSSSNKKTLYVVGSIALLLLLVINVILVIQNRDLKQRLEEFAAQRTPNILKVGDEVPSAVITMLDGQRKELSYSDSNKKYLLFLFNTTCGSCERNLPTWESIAASKQNGTYDILALSIFDEEKTRAFVSEKKMNLPVGLADTSFVKSYKIIGVPHTVVIDGNGTVQKIWSGTLKPENIQEIMNLLSAS